jgi:hypothetical protein
MKAEQPLHLKTKSSFLKRKISNFSRSGSASASIPSGIKGESPRANGSPTENGGIVGGGRFTRFYMETLNKLDLSARTGSGSTAAKDKFGSDRNERGGDDIGGNYQSGYVRRASLQMWRSFPDAEGKNEGTDVDGRKPTENSSSKEYPLRNENSDGSPRPSLSLRRRHASQCDLLSPEKSKTSLTPISSVDKDPPRRKSLSLLRPTSPSRHPVRSPGSFLPFAFPLSPKARSSFLGLKALSKQQKHQSEQNQNAMGAQSSSSEVPSFVGSNRNDFDSSPVSFFSNLSGGDCDVGGVVDDMDLPPSDSLQPADEQHNASSLSTNLSISEEDHTPSSPSSSLYHPCYTRRNSTPLSDYLPEIKEDLPSEPPLRHMIPESSDLITSLTIAIAPADSQSTLIEKRDTEEKSEHLTGMETFLSLPKIPSLTRMLAKTTPAEIETILRSSSSSPSLRSMDMAKAFGSIDDVEEYTVWERKETVKLQEEKGFVWCRILDFMIDYAS